MMEHKQIYVSPRPLKWLISIRWGGTTPPPGTWGRGEAPETHPQINISLNANIYDSLFEKALVRLPLATPPAWPAASRGRQTLPVFITSSLLPVCLEATRLATRNQLGTKDTYILLFERKNSDINNEHQPNNARRSLHFLSLYFEFNLWYSLTHKDSHGRYNFHHTCHHFWIVACASYLNNCESSKCPFRHHPQHTHDLLRRGA